MPPDVTVSAIGSQLLIQREGRMRPLCSACTLCAASLEISSGLHRLLRGARQARVVRIWKLDFIHLLRRYFGKILTLPHLRVVTLGAGYRKLGI